MDSLFDGKKEKYTTKEFLFGLALVGVFVWFTQKPHTRMSQQAFEQLPRAEKISYLKSQGLTPMTQEQFATLTHDQKVDYLKAHGVEQAR